MSSIFFRRKRATDELLTVDFSLKEGSDKYLNLAGVGIGEAVTIVLEATEEMYNAVRGRFDASELCIYGGGIAKPRYHAHIRFRVVDKEHSFSYRVGGDSLSFYKLGESITVEAASDPCEDLFCWIIEDVRPPWAIASDLETVNVS